MIAPGLLLRRLAVIGLAFAAAAPAGAAPLPPNAGSLPAKQVFGAVNEANTGAPRSIGSYAKGCLSGGAALAIDGPHWQAMRLSRNRNWGTPRLVAYVERFARDAAEKDGWRGLLVGDLSQPRGGPMLTGHASHQIGLDADIWILPMPDRRLSADERETVSSQSVLKPGTMEVDPARWPKNLERMIRRAVSYPDVARIFANPGIKRHLCELAGSDREWLRKVRPWWGHDSHIHVRLQCPPGIAGCADQDPPPPGDGCGAELAWWFEPRPPVKQPSTPPPPMPLSALPSGCMAVLADPAAPVGRNGLPIPAAAKPAGR